MIPHIVISPDSDSWAAMAADIIGQKINEVVSYRSICNVMLTGGNTAKALYTHWAKCSSLPLNRIRFFFGDERCVPPDHVDSNFALVLGTLLVNERPFEYSITRMEAENPDREAAARAYEDLLPESIDVLLLGMGVDGHIASLFPFSNALSTQRTVIPVSGLNALHGRLTITPPVIKHAKSVFLLAMGEEKGMVLAEAIKLQDDFMPLPVCLTLNGTWLLDDKAALQISTESR